LPNVYLVVAAILILVFACLMRSRGFGLECRVCVFEGVVEQGAFSAPRAFDCLNGDV